MVYCPKGTGAKWSNGDVNMKTETAEIIRSVEGYLEDAPPTPQRDGALIRELSLLFSLAAEDVDDAAVERFDGLFLSLADRVDAEARGYVAVRLSVAVNAPVRTVQRLAHDDIAVARPLLVHSPRLTTDDLIELAIAHGLDHMAAIAEREHLDVAVTDVLVFNGDDAVRRAVTGNHGARISERGFRRLAHQAGSDWDLGVALGGRPDTPEVVLQFLVRRHGPDLVEGQPLMKQNAARSMAGRSLEAWFGIFDFDAAADRLKALSSTGLAEELLLQQSLDEERFPETVLLLARMTGLGTSMLIGWMTGEDVGPFLVATRAIALPPTVLSAVLGVGPWAYLLDQPRRQQALLQFLAIEPKTARRQLATWLRMSRAAG